MSLGWIIFPPLSGMLDPCQFSSNNWKLISFGTTWLHPKLVLKKKKKPFPLSFSPSLASLYLFEQWLRLGVTSTPSVWLPLQDESLYVLPNCKSLWIKASAKWLNVNVNVTKNIALRAVCLHKFCTILFINILCVSVGLKLINNIETPLFTIQHRAHAAEVRGVTFLNLHWRFSESQYTESANQSEPITNFWGRGFIKNRKSSARL